MNAMKHVFISVRRLRQVLSNYNRKMHISGLNGLATKLDGFKENGFVSNPDRAEIRSTEFETRNKSEH
jgi:hypothetical protein